ncbi:MAG: hypothetical protein OHK0046_25980 [Anaerolineae bacterium]
MSHRLSLLLVLMVLCMGLHTSAAPVEAQSPTSNIFGIVEGMWFPDLTCDLNPGWERLIFDWSAHQPNGPDEWVGFLNIDDRWLKAASDCNREVVAVVKNTPAWATDGLPGAGVPRGLYLPIDDPGNVWANFMRQMGSYYASRGVRRFIIWNEPDIQPGTYGFEFEGTLEDYFQMVKVAHLAVKEGNPAASVHLAGTTFWHDVNSGERLYTDRLLERIVQDADAAQHDYYFDALSLHIYFRTDTVYDIVTTYRALLEKHGLGHKAIWITETNASPNRDPDWPVTRPQFQITVEQQAAFVVQAAALGLAAGAERIAVYKLYDQQLPEGGESFGLLYPADAAPRPAFTSWQTVIERFNGVNAAALEQTEQYNLVRLTHHYGQQTLVAWARTDEPVTLTINATSDKAYLFDQYGQHRLIRPVEGAYRLMLPAAVCERQEGCVVGGEVSILVQPAPETDA